VAAARNAHAPARSQAQRLAALARANEVRLLRAQLKRDLKSGSVSIAAILAETPDYLLTARPLELLTAVPGLGRVRAARLLTQCAISQAKTLGGLTQRQRSELLAHFRR
jgi:hypothetical protein